MVLQLFKFAAQLPGKKDAVYKECERYSIYLLYWYKSTNTDIWAASLRKCAHVHRLPTVREAVLVVLEASELLARYSIYSLYSYKVHILTERKALRCWLAGRG
jgi:hypothetical protein